MIKAINSKLCDKRDSVVGRAHFLLMEGKQYTAEYARLEMGLGLIQIGLGVNNLIFSKYLK